MIHTDGTTGIQIVHDGGRVTIRIYLDGEWTYTWSGSPLVLEYLIDELRGEP